MSCARVQERMAGLVAGAAGRRERLEVESHARRCARCAEAMSDAISASIALERAYAPLRSMTVALSPARVRLALRAPVPAPAPFAARVTRLTARLTEVALAAAVTAFAFVGSASVAPKTAIVEESAVDTTPTRVDRVFDDQNFIRWFRIGRYAASPDLVYPAVAPRHDEEEIATPHERAGLAR